MTARSSPLKTPQQSLLVLHCGGTMGMHRGPDGSFVPFHSIDQLIEAMCKHAPELADLYRIDSVTVSNIDSTNAEPHHWMALIQAIADAYENYDGFVVIHGTDTMAYTASAASFALGSLGKPVVFTGSLVPANMLGSDAVVNFTLACQVAGMDLGEVVIAFASSVLRGNRTTKVSESGRDAYRSPRFQPLGTLRLSPELDRLRVRLRHHRPLRVRNSFSGNVPVITLTPGLPPSIIEPLLAANIDGLVLEAYGSGNIPSMENNFLPVLAAAAKRIPVIITTQCSDGAVRMELYAAGRAAMELGVIPAGEMTIEAIYTKLLWILPQTRNIDEIRSLFTRNIAGEIDGEGSQEHKDASLNLRLDAAPGAAEK